MTTVNMQEQIKMLIELQELDRELFDRKIILDGIPGRIKDLDDGLQRESETLKSLEEELKKLQLQRKEREVELESKEQVIKKYQAQLYQVKTNQEYTALEKEIGSVKADGSLLEEEIIKLLDSMDDKEKNISKEKETIEEEKKKVNEEKNKIDVLGKAAKAEYDSLSNKRSEFAKNLDKVILSKYERILRSKNGLAVVPVSGGACGGCNMNLPPQVINEAKLRVDLRFCENCTRILYVEE